MSEMDLLRWVWKRMGTRRGGIIVDSGDDAAVVRTSAATLFKVDSVIEGVHFFPGTAPEMIGHKALARPLSDIAAMGGVPTFALVAMLMPRALTTAAAKRIYLGMERLAKRSGVAIVGGDIASHPGNLALSISVIGSMDGARPVTRGGARPGDVILVTGALGGSIRGRHLAFEPRLKVGRRFATTHRVHSMIDISDGLARDLGHICRMSGVAAELDGAAIPRTRGSSLDQALYDGEDYELLVTADLKTARRIEKAGMATAIGTIRKGRGMRLDGRPLPPRGYEHDFGKLV